MLIFEQFLIKRTANTANFRKRAKIICLSTIIQPFQKLAVNSNKKVHIYEE